MVWRKAAARLAGERQHPTTTSHPKHKAGDGARSFCTSPTATPHHPFRNNPPARGAVPYCGAKVKDLPGLACGGAVGTPPGITWPHGTHGLAALVGVEGCRVMEMPPPTAVMWEER